MVGDFVVYGLFYVGNTYKCIGDTKPDDRKQDSDAYTVWVTAMVA